MMPVKTYQMGDIVRMKKQHPCGSFEWEITRMGMDIGLKCVKCGHRVLMPRANFERYARKVVTAAPPQS